MPRIHRRPIERFKSNRSISVHKSEPLKNKRRGERPSFQERRIVHDRRRYGLPVKQERRKGDRRMLHLRVRPEIRTMMENSGKLPSKHEGLYIDEKVWSNKLV